MTRSALAIDYEARMRELAAKVEVMDERGRCTGCGRRYPAPPAPAVCEHCEIAAPLPPWREWPPYLRAWLVAQIVLAKMELYPKSKQTPWEQMLKAPFISGRVAPDGRIWKLATPASEVFLSALHLSADWVGSPQYLAFLTFLLGETPDGIAPDAR